MVERLSNVVSYFNTKRLLFFSSAIIYSLFLALENTRIPFLMIIGGLIILSLFLIDLELAILFIFGSLFIPISIQFAGIILRPADFLLGITFLLFLFELFLKGGTKVRPFPYHKTIIVFILTAILSLTRANQKWASLSDIIQMVELYVIGGIIFTRYVNDRLLKSLSKLIIIGIVLQLFLIFPALTQSKRFWGWSGGNLPFIGLFAGILTYHIIIYCKGKDRLFAIFAFAIICIELIASATRSAWLALITGIFIANYFISRKIFKKSLVVLLIVILLLVLVGPNLISSRIVSFTDPQFYSNVARIYLMVTAWNAFLDNPITGVGIKNLHYQISDYLPAMARYLSLERKITIMRELKAGSGAHNMYFAILAELGLLGFSCIAILVVLSLRDAYTNFKKSSLPFKKMKNSCIFSCLVAFFIMAFFVPGIHLRIECTIFFILLLSSIEVEKYRINKIKNIGQDKLGC